MSATLRHDMGLVLYYALKDRYPAVWGQLGAKPASRWGGIRHDRRTCMTFALKLPWQIKAAYALMKACERLKSLGGRTVATSAAVFYRKLYSSLGLPLSYPTDGGSEQAFLEAIDADPNDLVNWAVYADWLMDESASPPGGGGGWVAAAPSEIIRAWMGHKPTPVKYGVIQLARDLEAKFKKAIPLTVTVQPATEVPLVVKGAPFQSVKKEIL